MRDGVWVVVVPGSEWTCEHDHATPADVFACLDEFKRQRQALGLRFDLKIRKIAREKIAAKAAGA